MLKRTLALAVGFTLTVSAVLAQAADTLKVSAIPDEAPTELLRKFKPLGAYLEQQIGMKVEFVPVSDYPATRGGGREKETPPVGLPPGHHARPQPLWGCGLFRGGFPG